MRFELVSSIRLLLAGSVWAGFPLVPAVFGVIALDFLDGILAGGRWWPKPKLKRFVGLDLTVDTLCWLPIAGFALAHGVWPKALVALFIVTFPPAQLAIARWPKTVVLKPSSCLLFGALAAATVLEVPVVPAGLLALGFNPVLELLIHGFEFGSPHKVALTGLASFVWLAAGMLVTGYASLPALVFIPPVSAALADELGRREGRT